MIQSRRSGWLTNSGTLSLAANLWHETRGMRSADAEDPMGAAAARAVGYLRERAKERRISEEDLFALAEWKVSDTDVPEGDWYKDFGSFKL